MKFARVGVRKEPKPQYYVDDSKCFENRAFLL